MASNIYISKEDYEASKNFLVQFLRDSGYEGTLEDGTALHDVVVKAFALMYTLFKRQTQKVSSYLSLEHAVQMKDFLGDDYDAAVDSILANWFVQRKDGTKTTGTVRLWFTRPLPFLHVKLGYVLCMIDSVRYEISEEKVFAEENFNAVVNTVNNVTEYYIDVDVISMENTESAPTYQSKVAAYVTNIYFLRAAIIDDFLPGTLMEATEDFIRRTKKVITTREMITERAISTVLMDTFENLWNVYVAGYGDIEQMRDIKAFEGVVVHVGNKADIYCTSGYVNASDKLTVDFDGCVNLSSLGPDAVVSMVRSISRLEGDLKIPTTYNFLEVDEYKFGSAGASAKIYIGPAYHNDQVEIQYLTNPIVKEIRDFVVSSEQRVACYDPLVKSKFPIVTTFNVKITLKRSVTPEGVITQVKNAILSYINKIARYEEVYKESELISYVHILVPNVYAIEVPMVVTYRTFDPKTRQYVNGTIPDYLEPANIAITSQQFSANTLQLYTELDLINVTVEKLVD